MLPRVNEKPCNSAINLRFRGYLPVVVDVETGGFDAQTDALLEIAAVILTMDAQGRLHLMDEVHPPRDWRKAGFEGRRERRRTGVELK